MTILEEAEVPNGMQCQNKRKEDNFLYLSQNILHIKLT